MAPVTDNQLKLLATETFIAPFDGVLTTAHDGITTTVSVVKLVSVQLTASPAELYAVTLT